MCPHQVVKTALNQMALSLCWATEKGKQGPKRRKALNNRKQQLTWTHSYQRRSFWLQDSPRRESVANFPRISQLLWREVKSKLWRAGHEGDQRGKIQKGIRPYSTTNRPFCINIYSSAPWCKAIYRGAWNKAALERTYLLSCQRLPSLSYKIGAIAHVEC